MYPLLVATYASKAPRCDRFKYPAETTRPGFVHLMVLSFARRDMMEAIRSFGVLGYLTKEDISQVRWRVSVPDTSLNHMMQTRFDESMLELYMENENEPGTLRCLCAYPICGKHFEALPLVLRLGIELLIRKECRGSDPE